MTPKKPSTLTHYTSIEGFLGILKTRKIWASNVMYLNDKKELIHALNSIKNPISEIIKTLPNKPNICNALKLFSDSVNVENIPDTYAACFCDGEDKLSMWRGYSKNNQGIAISFGYNHIDKITINTPIETNKVIYSDFSTEKKLQHQLKSSINMFIDIDELIGYSEIKSMNYIENSIYLILARFKHFGFRDEGEWRLIIQDTNGSIPPEFRSHGNRIIPYTSIDLGGISNGIKKITIGPGSDQELTRKSIKKFMRHNGINDDLVEISKVPYRD